MEAAECTHIHDLASTYHFISISFAPFLTFVGSEVYFPGLWFRDLVSCGLGGHFVSLNTDKDNGSKQKHDWQWCTESLKANTIEREEGDREKVGAKRDAVIAMLTAHFHEFYKHFIYRGNRGTRDRSKRHRSKSQCRQQGAACPGIVQHSMAQHSISYRSTA